MFKKVFGVIAALTFAFGITTQAEMPAKVSGTFPCDYCAHNGDLWSN